MSPDCLFCKLASVKENILYETDNIFVLLDRFPFSDRHLLLIPKTHYPVLHECPDQILSDLILLSKKLALELKMKKYNILQNNVNQQAIPHVHLHLVGCNKSGSFNYREFKTLDLGDEEYSRIVREIKEALN